MKYFNQTKHSKHFNYGFTLVELMIAMVIGLIVLGIVTTNFSQMGQIFTVAKKESERLTEISRAASLIEGDMDPGSLEGGIFVWKVDHPDDSSISVNAFSPRLVSTCDPAPPPDPGTDPGTGTDAGDCVKRLHILHIIETYEVDNIAGDDPTNTVDVISSNPLDVTDLAGMLVNTSVSNRFFNTDRIIQSQEQYNRFSFFRINEAANPANQIVTVTKSADAVFTDIGLFDEAAGNTEAAGSNDFFPVPFTNVYGSDILPDTGKPFVTFKMETVAINTAITVAANWVDYTGPKLHLVEVVEYLLVPDGIRRDANGVQAYSLFRSYYPCGDTTSNLNAFGGPDTGTGVSHGCEVQLILKNVTLGEFDFKVRTGVDEGAGYNMPEIAMGVSRPTMGGGLFSSMAQTAFEFGAIVWSSVTKRSARPSPKIARHKQEKYNVPEEEYKSTYLDCNYIKGLTISNLEPVFSVIKFPYKCSGGATVEFTSDDYEVSEESMTQEQKFLEEQALVPADLIFLMDITASMKPYVQGVKDYIKAFVEELQTSGLDFFLHFRPYKDGLNEHKNPGIFATCGSGYTWPPYCSSTDVNFTTCAEANYLPRVDSGYADPVGDFIGHLATIDVTGGRDTPENPAHALAHALAANSTDTNLQAPQTGCGGSANGNLFLHKMPKRFGEMLNYPGIEASGGLGEDVYVKFKGVEISSDPGVDTSTSESVTIKIKALLPDGYFDLSKGRKNFVALIQITDTWPAILAANNGNPGTSGEQLCKKDGKTDDNDSGDSLYVSFTDIFSSGDLGNGLNLNLANTQLGEFWKNILLYYYILPEYGLNCKGKHPTKDQQWDPSVTLSASSWVDTGWEDDKINKGSAEISDYYAIKEDGYKKAKYQRVLIPARGKNLTMLEEYSEDDIKNNYNRAAIKSYITGQTDWGNLRGTSTSITVIGALTIDDIDSSTKAEDPRYANSPPKLLSEVQPLAYAIFEDVKKSDPVGKYSIRDDYFKIQTGIQLREVVNRIRDWLDPTLKVCELFGYMNFIAWPVVEKEVSCPSAPSELKGTDSAGSNGKLKKAIIEIGSCKDAAGQIRLPLAYMHVNRNAAEKGSGELLETENEFVYLNDSSSDFMVGKINEVVKRAAKNLEEAVCKKGDGTTSSQCYHYKDFYVLEIQTLYCCQAENPDQYEPEDDGIGDSTGTNSAADNALANEKMSRCTLKKSSRFIGMGTEPSSDDFVWDINYPK